VHPNLRGGEDHVEIESVDEHSQARLEAHLRVGRRAGVVRGRRGGGEGNAEG
jgi:hypothetical protein